MAETLILRLSARSDQIDWAVTAEDGSILTQGSGSVEDAAALKDQRNVIALAPAAAVLRIAVKIPVKGTAKIRQALPYALEEQVAGDIEAQHFAFSKADANGLIPVSIVADELINRWTSEISAAGIHLDRLYTESDGIPALPATISLLIDGDTVVIRDQHGEFTATDQDTLPIMLEMLLDQHSEQMENNATEVPVSLLAYCSQDAHEKHSALWDRLRMRTEAVDSKILTNGALAFLGEQLAHSPGINLLQGDYAPKSEFNIDITPWKIPLTLAAGLMVIALLFKGSVYWQLTQEDSALDAAASVVLEQTFPDAAGAADPWNVLQSRLGNLSSETSVTEGPGFSGALLALSKAFAKSNGIKLETLGYRTGTLDLQLLAPNVEALDKLRQQIDSTDQYAATIQSANPDNDQIKGRMQITAGAQP